MLPPLFRFVARLPELVLVGALAWCFAMAGFAGWLGLSTAMGALIAGVMISTFPYTLDVVAKVTSLRDFFVTLFFVGLGMVIPVPTWGVHSVDAVSLPVPRRQPAGHGFSGAVFDAAGLSRQPAAGHQPCQMSELSLVLLALGKMSGDVSDNIIGIAAFAFAFLAVGSTYAILGSDTLLRRATPWLHRLELHDLDHTAQDADR